VSRNRRRREVASQAQVAAQVAELRSEARRWWIRAFLAVVAGAAVAVLTVVVAVVLGFVALWALVRGFRVALSAQRIEDAAGG
jgi:hypothetical protein